MKRAISIFVVSLLFVPVFSFAEQRIVNNYSQYTYRPLSQEGSCQYLCTKRYSGDIDSYLQNGWRVISSRPVEIYISPFHVGPDSYCRCVGSEYILER